MIKVGFGQSDITPQPGKLQTGSYRRRVMSGVHDPLLACACVIDDGSAGGAVALVGIDAGVILRTTAESACQQIAASTGIAPSRVIISASHTHQGGPTLSTFYAEADPAYAVTVAAGVADAVKKAWDARTEATIASDFGRVSGIHFNRRFLMRDGREVTHPGKSSADIVRPAGPVDEKVGVLSVREATSGNVTGVVVNFGCHPTVTEDGNEYSADYVHYIREQLRAMIPGNPHVVFLLGACGDITQIDNRTPGWEKGHAWAQSMGAMIASAIARVLARQGQAAPPPGSPASPVACVFAEETVDITIRDRDAAAPPTRGLGSGDEWERIYAREGEFVAAIRQQSPSVEAHIRAVRIGDLAIVANGGELFCQPALDIQSASPIAKTWVVTLASEYLGYIPTASAHVAGGYEPRLARSSFLAVDAAQKIVQASLGALNKLT